MPTKPPPLPPAPRLDLATWAQMRRDVAPLASASAVEPEGPYDVIVWMLVTAPKCDQCDRAATRAFTRAGGRWCDDHKMQPHALDGTLVEAPDYPRARAWRAAERMLAVRFAAERRR